MFGDKVMAVASDQNEGGEQRCTTAVQVGDDALPRGGAV
jgi:hypothetical protein